VGITLSVGNLREKSLRDILRDSQVIRDLRNFRNTIKGACATCDQSDECYGCRGAAFQVTGDYLASDPLCWRHLEISSSEECPMPAEDLIPQKDPMRVVDRLVSVTPESAVVEVQVSSTPFVSGNGCLDETVHFELMAQSVAAMNGYQHRGNNGKPANGLLLGARNLKILGEARVGDTLRVSVVRHEEFEGFSIIRGTVHRGDVLLASGEIKVWTTPANPEEAKVSSGQEELSLNG
jgi:radical SAM protein with 4Fe4S-binding SPASM domain